MRPYIAPRTDEPRALRKTHINPLGPSVPPTMSQKNLRYRIAQIPAQITSATKESQLTMSAAKGANAQAADESARSEPHSCMIRTPIEARFKCAIERQDGGEERWQRPAL